jgi:integrase/recombinase XerD
MKESNRAMLETLYGCGLRVSELVSLKISDLFFEEGLLKSLGKGISSALFLLEVSSKYIHIYKSTIHLNVKKEHGDVLFLNRRGSQLKSDDFTIIKDLAVKIELHKK